MVQQDPELAKSTPDRSIPRTTSPRPQSSYAFRDVGDDPTVSRRASAASRYSLALPSFPSDIADGAESEEIAGSFTFIPPNSKKFYKRLVEICVDHDLRAMSTLEGDEEVSLGILSGPNLDLINECATRWRVGYPYRVTCSLDIIKYKYEREEVPLECIPEAMHVVAKAAEDLPLDDWADEDVRSFISRVYNSPIPVCRVPISQRFTENSSTSSLAPFIIHLIIWKRFNLKRLNPP